MKQLIAILIVMLCLSASAETDGFDKTLWGDDFFLGKLEDQWKLYDAGGTPILDYFWTDSELSGQKDLPFYGFQSNGLGIIRLGTADWPRFGCINRDGQFVIGPAYDSISEFQNGVAVVRNNNLEGLVHESGAKVLPVIYDSIVHEDPNLCQAVLDGAPRTYILYGDQAVPATAEASGIQFESYLPNVGDRTPVLDEPASLRLTENLPRLDGATALFPLYAGVAQAIYPDNVRFERTEEVENPTFAFTNTPGSYERLIRHQCDLIFTAQPSDKQLALATMEGVELELTPIASEAFVFFVNAENPLEGLTLNQIRGIYSGQIVQWSELGLSNLGDILAYQRPANSGSQTAMEHLMGDTPLMPLEDTPMSMTGIVEAVMYSNTSQSIGYSFRFFVSEMMESDVKLLAIEGVMPTEENIVNGSYPLIYPVYAVSRKDETNPNVSLMLNWLRSDQGRELIRRSGYTPVQP